MNYPFGQKLLPINGRIGSGRFANGGFAIWAITAALLVGLVLAFLPLKVGGAVVVGAAVLLLIFIQPLFGLLVGLIVGPFGAVESLYLGNLLLDSGQIVFLLTVAVWLARSITKRRIVLPRTRLNLPLLLFIGLTSVTVLYAPSSLFGVKEVFKWVEILLVMWIVVDMVADQQQEDCRVANGSRQSLLGRLATVQGVVFMLLLAGLSQALMGIWQFGLRGDGPEHFEILGGFYRAYGTFEQPNPFGGYMSMAACLGIGVLLGLLMPRIQNLEFVQRILVLVGVGPGRGAHQGDHVGTPPKVWWLLFVGGCSAALIAALVFSWSRGAWLGFGAGMTTLALFFPRRRWIGLLLIVVGGGLFLVGNQFGLIPASISARINSFQDDLSFGDVRGVDINDANYAVLERLAHWQAALDMAKDNLWTGVGFGNYEPAYGDYALINWPFPLGHAHNYYLNILAETGVPGLVVYLFLWGVIVWQAAVLVRKLDWPRRGIALGLLAVWVTLSVHHLVDKLYVNNLYVFLGAILGLQQILDEGK
ncbi:MAG: O-antigen ligase family protein [Candidatus Promineifilaceae bacterium]